MALDLAVLATTAVSSFLLPYAKIGVQKLVEGMAGQVGKSTAEYGVGVAKQVWERVKAAFSSDDDQAAIEQFEKRPDAAKGLIEAVLKEKLEQDPVFAQELDKLVNGPGPDGKTSGAQIMHAGIAGIVDVRGANFMSSHGVYITAVQVGDSSSKPEAGEKK
jgi:hypothetical protein